MYGLLEATNTFHCVWIELMEIDFYQYFWIFYSICDEIFQQAQNGAKCRCARDYHHTHECTYFFSFKIGKMSTLMKNTMQIKSFPNLIHIRNALWINIKLSIDFNIYFHWYGLKNWFVSVPCYLQITHTHEIGSIIRAKCSAFTNFLFIDIVWEIVVFCANTCGKKEQKGNTSRRSATLCECGNSKRDA